MQTREDNIDIDKKKRNRLLSFSYWLRRFQSHYRGLAKRLICFSCSLVKSEFIGFENPSYGETRKNPPFPPLPLPSAGSTRRWEQEHWEPYNTAAPSSALPLPVCWHLWELSFGSASPHSLSPVWGGCDAQGMEDQV